MNRPLLPLRQRKLLYLLQNSDQIVTGGALAKALQATSRTIRSDVSAINQYLAPLGAEIASIRGKGYVLRAERAEDIRGLLQGGAALYTREDRVRYLCLRLCLSDVPLHIQDLEEEMFVSRTALENDVKYLRRQFGALLPLRYGDGLLSFAASERGRREVLTALYSEAWDYSEQSSAFYSSDYLNLTLLAQVTERSAQVLKRRSLMVEDAAMVRLNLNAAIMLQRVPTGHVIPAAERVQKEDVPIHWAVEELADLLEEQFHCPIPAGERDRLYEVAAAGHIIHSSDLDASASCQVFQHNVLEMVDQYLTLLMEQFHLDFGPDTDFYVTLLQLVRTFQLPVYTFGKGETLYDRQEFLLQELELAWLFQRISFDITRRYLTRTELILLSDCLAGALDYLYVHQRSHRVRCVILCHTSLSIAWTMKRRIMRRFAGTIEIVDLLPVNEQSPERLANADLILSTVRRPEEGGADTLVVSTRLTPADLQTIDSYLQRRWTAQLYPIGARRIRALFEQAWWDERAEAADWEQLLAHGVQRLREEGVVSEAWERDFWLREQLCTHLIPSGVLFLPSLQPAADTRLCIVIPAAPVLVRRHRIMAVVTAAFLPEDRAFAFHLVQFIHRKNQHLEQLALPVTREHLFQWMDRD